MKMLNWIFIVFVMKQFRFCFWKCTLKHCLYKVMMITYTSFLWAYVFERIFPIGQIKIYSTGASDRGFYPIFNKSFHYLETLLRIHKPKKVLSTGSLCGPLVPSPQSKCPKRTFILPQTYHASIPNTLS